ncbi:MAG TPA: RNA 2',3'-cyclic phosphodiesterase [Planococcus sp. (in: firmicutes)]|nr:RNA 2',3'-cyclic phosphodiesterase [Planococcus sp. (in: firmicutes)]
MENHYFIGIKIPLPVAQSLVEQRESWGLSSHKRYPVAEDLHITLLFIGADPEGEIMAATEALQGIAHSPFTLKITGTGYFGIKERPGVVYGAIEENDSLNALQDKIKTAFSDFNLSPDTKPFVPHITLANKWAGKDLWEEIPALGPDSFRAEEFSLFRIEPGSIPRFIAVKTYKLKDGV